MNLNADDSRPPYLQVAEDLRAAIRGGTLKPGDKLPSTRELCDRYGIASMTVQNALRALRDDGLIYSVPGRGSYVRTKSGDARDDGGAAPTPEYVAIMRQLDAVTDEMNRLADRVSELERMVRQDSARPPKRSR